MELSTIFGGPLADVQGQYSRLNLRMSMKILGESTNRHRQNSGGIIVSPSIVPLLSSPRYPYTTYHASSWEGIRKTYKTKQMVALYSGSGFPA